MREKSNLPPPTEYLTFSPSELFRFFFQIGRWTEDSFSADFQNYTRGKLISTVTINKWKNRNVIPTRYSGHLFKMIEDQFTPPIAKDWIMAFEIVWALHVARPGKVLDKTDARGLSDIIRRQHSAWINTRYKDKINGDVFSASDIYVPLQLTEYPSDFEKLYNIEDLLANISESNGFPKQQDWTFICGGPGSGKSMTAIHLAQEITKRNFFPIFIRGSHLSEIDIDIQTDTQPVIDSFSVKSFLQHFRASNQMTACLILDGVDEISSASAGSIPKLTQILTDLCLEQNVCRAHGKTLHVIALGRQSHIEFSRGIVPVEKSHTFNLLGLDGCNQLADEKIAIGHDLRAEWWSKFLDARGIKADPVLPNFLSLEYDDYSDFSSEPLLTYLICRFALRDEINADSGVLPHEIVNAFTHGKHRSEIYKDILGHIYTHTTHQTGQTFDFHQFKSILQHMALAIWQSETSGSASLSDIQNKIQDPQTKAAFQALNLTAPQMLKTTFYYQLTRNEETGDFSSVEFTHKSFSDYLISTLIVDCFEQLISAFETMDGLNEALINWAKISCKGLHTPNLAEFCQKEAALRYESFSNLDWDLALTIIAKHLIAPSPEKAGISIISETQSSASLLLFLWSCLNIERQKRTGQHFNLFDTKTPLRELSFKYIQLPNSLSFNADTLTEPQLQHQTFLTPSLSALHLRSADMSQFCFSIGHLQSLKCEESSFAMSHWSHVKTTTSHFQKSIFQQATFHGNRWIKTNFTNCLFQAAKIQFSSFSDCSLINTIFSQCHFSDVDFIATQMEGIIFDRCTFVNCNFDTQKSSTLTNIVKFRYCSFLGMKNNFQDLPSHNFEECHFQTKGLNKRQLEERTYLDDNIGELLN